MILALIIWALLTAVLFVVTLFAVLFLVVPFYRWLEREIDRQT